MSCVVKSKIWYMDLLFPRYMIFNTIVIFMACLKKYEIKNFVILNYKLIKDKISPCDSLPFELYFATRTQRNLLPKTFVLFSMISFL